jgi:hypothetical protein
MLKREYFQSRHCHEKIQTFHPYNFYTSGPFDKRIQQIELRYLINPWLVEEKGKPIIVCDAYRTLHFEPILFLGKLAHLGLLGM